MVRRAFLSIFTILILVAQVAPPVAPVAAQTKSAAKPAATPAAAAAPKITTPKEQFGFNIGDDYQLATYAQFEQYWKKLATESPRMKLVDIGKTAQGRTQWMSIVTSPENFKKLDRYEEISRRLALAEGLSDAEAQKLAEEGKAVVWIDGGLHATEVLGAHQLMEMLYQMLSRTDAETMRILNDVIILFVHANPDGMELVSSWYMREKDPARRSTGGLPVLYQHYVGHDNNRDFYMSAQNESINMNRMLYMEWFPQIMYNHHQTGPAGTVLFAPPFRAPHNYNLDPLTQTGLDLVGAAMHHRFIAENKPGATMRKGTSYSTWFNGGLRTTTYFHNMIGLLTETIGNPTPMQIPFRPERQLPNDDLPFPVPPQEWHFRQSIEYSMTANRAVLDLASRLREEFLYNIYVMGRNSIARGNSDHWTVTPKRMEALVAEINRDLASGALPAGGGGGGRGGRGGAGGGGTGGGAAAGGDAPSALGGPASLQVRGQVPLKYYDKLHDPVLRDPRGYILPSDQVDFLTATKFMNTLLKNGVTVHRATAAFQVKGKSYPAGSYVVKCAQAFRPHILDMFEPQDHPDDIPYPGGTPTPPYDATGYTLAFQMGVQFDRVLEAFDGPFEKLPMTIIKPAPGAISGPASSAGYVFSHAVNDSFVAVNRLLKAGEDVSWIGSRSMYVAAKPSTRAIVERLAADTGLSFTGVASQPAGDVVKLRPVRIGLADVYGGSMPSGWIRWLLEQFEFPFQQVFTKTLDEGNLNAKFDVLVFPSGTLGGGGRVGGGAGGAGFVPPGDAEPGAGAGAGGGFGQPAADRVPAEYQHMLGRVTPERTIPQIKKFIEDGGAVVAIGSSTSLGGQLGLPLTNFLVDRGSGSAQQLPRSKYYVPGSVLRVAVDTSNPIAYGMPAQADVFFDNSPVYDLLPAASLAGVRPLMWFDSDKPLRSGWAWGQHYLKGGVAAVTADVGKGKLFLLGPEVTFRAQPHGTFKLLFNSIYYGPAARKN